MDPVKHRRFVVVLSALVLAAFGIGVGASLLPLRGADAETEAKPKPATSAAPAAAPVTKASAAPAGLEGWIEGVVGEPVAGSKVVVGGWAADRVAGAPVAKVEVLLDGKPVATANLGVARADVAKTIGRDGYARSGWNAVLDLTGVSPGKHEVTAVAYGKDGARQPLSGTASIDVRSAP